MTVDRSHKGLSRASVVRAALDLVEDGGLDRLTIRAVAARLGVSPMAVYNHAVDREDLLVGMLEASLAELTTVSGLSRNALSARLHRARSRLAKLLRTEMERCPSAAMEISR